MRLRLSPFLVFIFLILLLIGCNQSQEEITLDELSKNMPRRVSKLDTSGITDFNKRYGFDSLSFFSKKMVSFFKLDTSKVFILRNKCLPDRFNPVKCEKWSYGSKKDTTLYYHWKFKDTTASFNAFYNWIEHFGYKNQSLKMGHSVLYKGLPFVLLVQDKSIVFLEFTNTPKLENLLDDLTTLGYGRSWKYILSSDKSRKIRWMSKDDNGDLIKIDRDENTVGSSEEDDWKINKEIEHE